MAYSSAAWSNRVPLPRRRTGAATQRCVTCSQPPHMLPSNPPSHSPRPLLRKKPTGYQLSWPVAAMLYEARDSVMNRLSASLGSGSNTISSFSISRSRGRFVEDPHQVTGLPPGGVCNLMAAARAVGDEQGVRRRGAHLRQYAEFANFQRHLVVLGLIAERSGHAAACRIERLDGEAADQL